ncbi:lipopolysaccharide biosynthesis protein [Rathayibacter sp. ZW T2_19]|uniref:Lipopolysaccharide biosynthesis protein n=1 Tax=Rathayibacter rubneri TaxID=2950106 RepID=A0A9X2IRM4_9MICO|nr:lipopolysaccharide biosynthesis protein [Rathayibacter rubneri]MCM6761082.1 lipopolysaccharide biosynthesis protein [Rathayibacter rubneri]
MSAADDGDFSKRLSSSFLWSFVDKWVSRVFTLAVFVILGRVLAPSDFGAVALATAYVALVTIFVDAGFGNALIQKKDLSAADIGTAFTMSAGIGLVLGGLSFAFADLVAVVFDAGQVSDVLRVLSLALFVQGLSSVPAALLERRMQFKALAIRRTTATLLSGLAAVIAALAGWGVWALVVQSLGFAVIGGVLVWVSAWRHMSFRFSRRSLRDLTRTSFDVFGIQLVGYANSQGDRLVVGLFLGVEALGQYFFAMRIISLCVELFTAVFSNVGLSAFSKLQDDIPRLRELLNRLTGITSLATIPVFAVLGAFADQIVPFVFGEQWLAAVPVLQILVFLGAINALLVFDRPVLIAVGRSKTAFLLSLAQTAVGLGFVVLGAPWGVLGVAPAVVLRQYLFWPIRLYFVARAIQLRVLPYVRGWLVAMLALVLGWLAVLALQPPAGIAVSAVGFVVTVCGVYAILARSEVLQGWQTIRRFRKR